MISLNVSLKGKETVLQFYFKKWDDAEKAQLSIENRLAFVTDGEPHLIVPNFQTVVDDFGQRAIIDTAEVSACIVIDTKRYLEAAGEIGIMQAQAQQNAQTKANSLIAMPKRPPLAGFNQ